MLTGKRLGLRFKQDAGTIEVEGADCARERINLGEIAMANETKGNGSAPGAGTLLPRTADQILGPFYPLVEPSKGGDLTRVAGHKDSAQGQVIYLGGRVLDRTGQPVRGGKLQIWQANTFGKYNHPNDDNAAPLDPNFEGFAVVHTDDDGRYSLKTVKPGAYPTGPSSVRPSHIHFEVFGKRERLITQMYFVGDPHHETDRFLQSSNRQETIVRPILAADAGMDAGAKRVIFDIVLMHG
jgi:protocatechuate 3,4-dioxygenase, beta subunit